MSTSKPYRLVQGTERLVTAPFTLQSGEQLPRVDVRYAIYGEPNEAGDNITLVCHALSGSSRVDQWWPTLLEGVFDLERDCVVCTNIIGSCYGSTGPYSIDPRTGSIYGGAFPRVTVRDIVRAQQQALAQLGLTHFRAVIGSSLGGMQAIHWAIDFPEAVDRCISIGVAPLGALALGLNHLQRRALSLDAEQGLALARAIGMCSYKSPGLFELRHGRKPNRTGPAPWQSTDGRFDVAGYLDHQADIFLDRFDSHSYRVITHALDLFDPAREYGSAALAWERVSADVLLIGISSDWLFPAGDVRALATELRDCGINCAYHEIVSDHGHDAFLAEPEKLIPALKSFLDNPVARELAAAAQTGTYGDHDGTHS